MSAPRRSGRVAKARVTNPARKRNLSNIQEPSLTESSKKPCVNAVKAPAEEKLPSIAQVSRESSSARRKFKIKRKPVKADGISNEVMGNLIERNLEAVPVKHRFYHGMATKFLQDGHVKGCKTFKGIYPTSKKVMNENVYALMLDWFWSTRKQSCGSATSWGEMRGFHGYLGAALSTAGKCWKDFGLAVST